MAESHRYYEIDWNSCWGKSNRYYKSRDVEFCPTDGKHVEPMRMAWGEEEKWDGYIGNFADEVGEDKASNLGAVLGPNGEHFYVFRFSECFGFNTEKIEDENSVWPEYKEVRINRTFVYAGWNWDHVMAHHKWLMDKMMRIGMFTMHQSFASSADNVIKTQQMTYNKLM